MNDMDAKRFQEQLNNRMDGLVPLPTDEMQDMVHDVRGFLNLILPSVDIVKRQLTRIDCKQTHPVESEKIHRCLRNIQLAVEQIDRLADSFTSDKLPQAPRSENLKTTLGDIVDCYQNTHSRGERVYELYYDLKEEYWIFDKIKLIRVMNNLLNNATKYTERGVIILKANEEPDSLEISVKDPGCGISKEKIDHIFERFYQVGGENQKPGSGIGLDITLSMIKSMGGSIRVNSKLGLGTVFTVKLPREQ